MRFPTSEQVARLRERFPKGTRLELTAPMDDPYSRLQPGDQGVVEYVDDAGTIHMRWDRGSSLGLVPGVDSFKKV